MIAAMVQACVLFSNASAEHKTLAEIALANDLKLDNEICEFANLEMTSHEVLTTAKTLIIAGYILSEDKNDLSILHVFIANKKSGLWKHKTFNELPLGSVIKVEMIGSLIFISMHLTPSSGTQLIVTEELEFYDRLHGWTVSTLNEDFVIYHQGQVHFAPTHEVELSLYQISKRIRNKIFPPSEKTKYRAHLSKILADKYSKLGLGWCAARNHHCDPERMDSYMVDGIQKSPEDESVSFVISYNEAVECWPEQRRLVRYNIGKITSEQPTYIEEVLEGLCD